MTSIGRGAARLTESLLALPLSLAALAQSPNSRAPQEQPTTQVPGYVLTYCPTVIGIQLDRDMNIHERKGTILRFTMTSETKVEGNTRWPKATVAYVPATKVATHVYFLPPAFGTPQTREDTGCGVAGPQGGEIQANPAPPQQATPAPPDSNGSGTLTVPAADFEKCMQVDPRMMIERAAAGYAQGEFCAGYYYMDGAGGVPKNPAQGVRYFLSAANHGYVLAYGYLGHFYKHGTGVPQDWSEAERWYRKGAEQGDPGSQNDLAVLLLDGGNGVRKDPSEALKWANMANQQNYPSAFNLLAHIKAASQPQRKEPAEDLFEEGVQLYRSGKKDAAVKPFLAAAQAGNSLAQLQIGWHYEKGVGVAQSYAEAARWYRKSADQDNSTAMKNLGQLYEEGAGVREDWVEAAKWYQQSANLANADGEAALGRAYEFGIGVPLSRKVARVWDERAAAQGNAGSAFFARHLKGGNSMGFRNGQERDVFPGMEILPVYNEWTGVTFHNSGERMSYLRAARREYDQGVAAIGRAQYMQKLNEYQACKTAGGTNCSPPYRPPQ